MSELELNQQAADRICAAGGANGRHIRRGEWVALLDGNVVAVTPDLSTALRALRIVDADPSRGMVFEAAPPVQDVIR